MSSGGNNSGEFDTVEIIDSGFVNYQSEFNFNGTTFNNNTDDFFFTSAYHQHLAYAHPSIPQPLQFGNEISSQNSEGLPQILRLDRKTKSEQLKELNTKLRQNGFTKKKMDNALKDDINNELKQAYEEYLEFSTRGRTSDNDIDKKLEKTRHLLRLWKEYISLAVVATFTQEETILTPENNKATSALSTQTAVFDASNTREISQVFENFQKKNRNAITSISEKDEKNEKDLVKMFESVIQNLENFAEVCSLLKANELTTISQITDKITNDKNEFSTEKLQLLLMSTSLLENAIKNRMDNKNIAINSKSNEHLIHLLSTNTPNEPLKTSCLIDNLHSISSSSSFTDCDSHQSTNKKQKTSNFHQLDIDNEKTKDATYNQTKAQNAENKQQVSCINDQSSPIIVEKMTTTTTTISTTKTTMRLRKLISGKNKKK